MQCPVCSTTVVEGETVCPFCHVPLEALPPARTDRAALVAAYQALPHLRTQFFYVRLIALGVVSLTLVILLASLLLGWVSYFTFCCIWVGGAFLTLLGQSSLYHYTTKKAMQQMLSGAYGKLLHWTYSEQEWRQFVTQEYRDLGRGLRWFGVFASLLLVVGLLSLGLFQVSSLNPMVGTVMTLSGIFFAISMLFMLSGVVGRRLWQRQRTSDAYISIGGIIVGGQYQSLIGLPRITYETGDPAKIRWVIFRGSPRLDKTEVPVPRGCEAEAKRWVEDLQQEDFSFCGHCGKPIATGVVCFSRYDDKRLCYNCYMAEGGQSNHSTFG